MPENLFLSKTDMELNVILDDSRQLPGPLFVNSTENQPVSNFNEFVSPMSNMVIGNEGRYSYSNHIINPYEREQWWISMDHCYARPWDWKPESSFLRPTKTLFMSKPPAVKRRGATHNVEEEIDVDGGIKEITPIYDTVKAKSLMDECEKYAVLARGEDGTNDWEETISRITWTPTQNRLFNSMMNILNNDCLARLVYTNSQNEPIARRVAIDKSVERVRRLLATVSWDPKFTQWLHQLLIENLTAPNLASYLDILQTLKSKVPIFVDKMMSSANSSRLSMLSYESLFPLMKRPWDPVASSLMQDKPKKLPGNPIIVVIPSTPVLSTHKQQRMQKWIALLSNLATVVTIPLNYGSVAHKMTMSSYVDQMFLMTKSKIQDLRTDFPSRNIVLVGFNFGGTLALQVAQVEQVLCVICLGFSINTADGKRGDPDDNLLELQCPVLFVIGQCSNTSLQEEMEDLRERMRVETGLVVVGSADDSLRVNKKKKRAEGITQSVVDRCITDEVGEFISCVILSPYPPQIRQSPTNLTTDNSSSKKIKTERKRYNSNTSSLDSEPPSPTPRITRPVGRPPGSKSKAKLETKWASQGIPSSPSNSPPPIITPDTSSNDSSLTDKTLPNTDLLPIKKLKTLKPNLSSPEKQLQFSTQNTSLKNQTSAAKALNFQSRTLSNLLQTDIQTLAQHQSPTKSSAASSIKVLENVKLNSGVGPHSKFLTAAGKSIDMTKLAVINTMKPTTGSSIVLLPDGKIKTVNTTTKGGRYITSKRQLIGNKPPKPVKKSSFLPQTCALQGGNLPPPTNLTTQDIMDLPIIFADDNQLLENTTIAPDMKPTTQLISSASQLPPKIVTSTAGNKFVLINKQIPMQSNISNFMITPTSTAKKSNPPVPSQNKVIPKYTKIILSSKKGSMEELKAASSNIISKISNLPSEISVKKVTPITTSAPTSQIEVFDLENEIAASTLYKPTASNSDGKNITIVTSKSGESVINETIPITPNKFEDGINTSQPTLSTDQNKQPAKRSIEEVEAASMEEHPAKIFKENNEVE